MAQYGYTQQFSDMMELAELLSNEQFSVFLNDVVAPYVTNIPRDTTGFRQLPLKPPYKLTYEALQKENNIGIMANHVDLEAHAKPTPTRGISALEGGIPHIATNITMGKEDYLREAKLLSEAEEAGRELKIAAQDMLSAKLGEKIQEHYNRASYMRDYVVFNGKYDITTTNNDGSYTGISLDFKVPSRNKTTLTGTNRWWTDDNYSVEGANATPIADIDEILLDMENENIPRSTIVIEIGLKTLSRLARHNKVRSDLALFLNPSLASVSAEERATTTMAMSQTQLESALAARLGIKKFLVRNFRTSIPKANIKTGRPDYADMTGYKEDVLVFRQEGEIGEIHSTSHLIVGGDAGSDGRYAFSDGGRILVSYTCNVREKVQIWDTEETVLYVLTAGKKMRYLTVK